MAERSPSSGGQKSISWLTMSPSLSIFIHGQHLNWLAGNKKLKQCVFHQVYLALYYPYQFVTGITDRVIWSRISMQKKEAVTRNLCGTEEFMTHIQRLWHLISERGRGFSAEVTSLTMLAECLGLQPNLGCMGGSEMGSLKVQHARELIHLYSPLTWN